jgi:hypothetical protein
VDEDIEYARRLIRAGVPTELHVYPGAFHGFNNVAHAQVAQAFNRDYVGALTRALKRNEAFPARGDQERDWSWRGNDFCLANPLAQEDWSRGRIKLIALVESNDLLSWPHVSHQPSTLQRSPV